MGYLLWPVSHLKVAEAGFELRPSDSKSLLLTMRFYCFYDHRCPGNPERNSIQLTLNVFVQSFVLGSVIKFYDFRVRKETEIYEHLKLWK